MSTKKGRYVNTIATVNGPGSRLRRPRWTDAREAHGLVQTDHLLRQAKIPTPPPLSSGTRPAGSPDPVDRADAGRLEVKASSSADSSPLTAYGLRGMREVSAEPRRH